MSNKNIVSFIVIMLILTLLIAGCSGSNSSNGSEEAIQQEGKIILKIEEATIQEIPDKATSIKLRVFNDKQNIIKDIPLPEDGEKAIEVSVPIGIYDIAALAHLNYKVYTIGIVEGIQVKQGDHTDANIKLQRPEYSIELYRYDEVHNKVAIDPEVDKIKGGTKFTISLTIDEITKKIFSNKNGTDFGFFTGYVNDSSEACFNKSDYLQNKFLSLEVTSPSESEECKLEIKTTLYLSLDNRTYDCLYMPNRDLGEEPFEVTVTPPEGGIE